MCFTISFIEKDGQLITLIIIMNWSVWLLCKFKVAPKIMLFSLLRLDYFNLLYGTLSLSWTTPTAHPPTLLFFFLKRIQCLAVTLNLDSKCGTKDWHWCKQKCGVQFLNSRANLDDLCRLHPLSPQEAPWTSRWGVNCRDAHGYLQLSDINIRFAKKKIDHLYFYLFFVFSKG